MSHELVVANIANASLILCPPAQLVVGDPPGGAAGLLPAGPGPAAALPRLPSCRPPPHSSIQVPPGHLLQ